MLFISILKDSLKLGTNVDKKGLKKLYPISTNPPFLCYNEFNEEYKRSRCRC